MRVLFAISTLGAGGAERVITLLANALAQSGHGVTVLTFDSSERDFFATDPGVRRVALNLVADSGSFLERINANFKRIRAVRHVVARAQPDVVVSFVTETNVTALLACAGLGIPVVISERIDPREHRVGRAWSLLRRATYRLARVLVVQTEDIATWCRANWPVRLVVAIPNPVALTVGDQRPCAAPTHPYMLAVGRLDPQKGFDILIRAFAMVAHEYPALELRIAGDGPERERLQRLATDAGVVARVWFLGRVPNVRSLMSEAFAFVLSSRYEGFPNVLVEALASGTATVATDCRSGPREILKDGEYGLLVPCNDPVALAAGLRRICDDPDLRQRLRDRGPAAVAPFALENIVSSWAHTLAAVRST